MQRSDSGHSLPHPSDSDSSSSHSSDLSLYRHDTRKLKPGAVALHSEEFLQSWLHRHSMTLERQLRTAEEHNDSLEGRLADFRASQISADSNGALGKSKSTDLLRETKEHRAHMRSLWEDKMVIDCHRARVALVMIAEFPRRTLSRAFDCAVVEIIDEEFGSRDLFHYLDLDAKARRERDRFARACTVRYSPPPPPSQRSRDPPLWCPITHDYCIGRPCRAEDARHIVPFFIGEQNMAWIFGESPDHGHDMLISVENAIIMCAGFGWLLDYGRMLILPDPKDDKEFIAFFLDENLRSSDKAIDRLGAPPYRAVHMRRLVFKTSCRPSPRYLFAHMCFTLFARKWNNVKGHEKDVQLITSTGLLSTPRRYLRTSFLRSFANAVGFRDLEYLERGCSEFTGEKSPEGTRIVAVDVACRIFSNNDSDDDTGSGYRGPGQLLSKP